MRAKGPFKADGIVVLEGEFSLLGAVPKIAIKAAYHSSKSGMTHGLIEFWSWSDETIKAFHAFKEQLELDLIASNFEQERGNANDTNDDALGLGDLDAGEREPTGLGDPEGGPPGL